MSERERQRERKPYTPPELEEIELMPEETLSAGCKLAASGPSGGSGCILGSCVSDIGS
jgi:hypothetical protein